MRLATFRRDQRQLRAEAVIWLIRRHLVTMIAGLRLTCLGWKTSDQAVMEETATAHHRPRDRVGGRARSGQESMLLLLGGACGTMLARATGIEDPHRWSRTNRRKRPILCKRTRAQYLQAVSKDLHQKSHWVVAGLLPAVRLGVASLGTRRLLARCPHPL